jgi:hypothetical protein
VIHKFAPCELARVAKSDGRVAFLDERCFPSCLGSAEIGNRRQSVPTARILGQVLSARDLGSLCWIRPPRWERGRMTQQWDFPVDEPVSLQEWRVHRTTEQLPAIAERIAAGETLRAVAADQGMSHEALRQALTRAGYATRKAVALAAAPRRSRGYRVVGGDDPASSLRERSLRCWPVTARARASGPWHAPLVYRMRLSAASLPTLDAIQHMRQSRDLSESGPNAVPTIPTHWSSGR